MSGDSPKTPQRRAPRARPAGTPLPFLAHLGLGGERSPGPDAAEPAAPSTEAPSGPGGLAASASPQAEPGPAAPRPAASPRPAPAGSGFLPYLGGGGSSSGGPRTVALHETARERYLNYALSVITSRAIPDVRDGLKPVQRRILYAMFRDLKLHSRAKARKSAAVVGEVMGRYHPHGDSAIYDAMVRMAQPFNLRYPLVDGQGNFGSVDGDPAAAMRYTETRLRALADQLLGEIEQDTVPWRPTYEGTRNEPVVLPARVPHLLVNGASGIAVGMSTQIPPHNLREVVAACLALLENPELEVADLCAFVPGPDFPTGGEILNSPEELLALYQEGRGAVRLRGTWQEERVERKECIVIDSIPYQQNKATLVEKIGALILGRKVPQLVDVRDESTDRVRVVLELRKGAKPDEAMAYLCRHTPLQQSFHVQLNCLVPGDSPEVCVPQRLDLKQVLQHFLDFRRETLTRRLSYELSLLERRIHILAGFEAIFAAIEEAVRIVLHAESRADAAQKLCERFLLDDEQAQAILETRLYRLARLEIATVQAELAEKRAEAARLRALLGDPAALRAHMAEELRGLAEEHGDERRTRIGLARELDFDPKRYVLREETHLIVTRDGWVKRQGSFSDLSSIRLREGSEIGWIFRTHTLATVTFITSLGKAYTLRVDDVRATTGHGDAIQLYFDFADKEAVVGVICHDPRCLLGASGCAASAAASEGEAPSEDEPELLAEPEGGSAEPEAADEDEAEGGEAGDGGSEAEHEGPWGVALTRRGRGQRFLLEAHREPSNRAGRKVVRLQDEDKDGVVAVYVARGGEMVSLATEQGRVLLFAVEELKLLLGPGRGVQAIKLGAADRVLAFGLSRGSSQGVRVQTQRGREIVVSPRRYRPASRGGKGTEVIRRGGLSTWLLPPVEMVGEEPEVAKETE